MRNHPKQLTIYFKWCLFLFLISRIKFKLSTSEPFACVNTKMNSVLFTGWFNKIKLHTLLLMYITINKNSEFGFGAGVGKYEAVYLNMKTENISEIQFKIKSF